MLSSTDCCILVLWSRSWCYYFTNAKALSIFTLCLQIFANTCRRNTSTKTRFLKYNMSSSKGKRQTPLFLRQILSISGEESNSTWRSPKSSTLIEWLKLAREGDRPRIWNSLQNNPLRAKSLPFHGSQPRACPIATRLRPVSFDVCDNPLT